MRSIVATALFVTTIALGATAHAGAGRSYRARPYISVSGLEKVKLKKGYTMLLPRDQDRRGTFAPARGGHQILIAQEGSGGEVRYGKAELVGSRGYKSRRAIERELGIRISSYKEKSVVAYLPSKDPSDARPRFYTVIGPKSGKGPLLIERRPSRLTGGKPLEYSVLEL